ncbi:MAG: hypothetical protein Q7U35_12180 [Methanobacteriaceae archaeon]|nr:hypothetical protein [Methanobacteriaceae archaeon]MDP2837273.1 hypothetical protein [Methanobacteriaceae archaeon]MDP3485261.1 hypothetical protein [Methanobacteriaceae archaeon]MDP3623005.1 hypothetical protein [Methanobacteriaceae archaeon]
MIYLLITLAGVVFLFLGLIGMYFGFQTPPNILSFLAGLISFVLGLMAVILFAGKIDLSSLKKSVPVADETSEVKSTMTKRSFENVRSDKKPSITKKPVKPAKIAPKITPKKAVNATETSKPKVSKSPEDTIVEKTKVDHPIKPARKPRKFLKLPKKGKKDSYKLKETSKENSSEAISEIPSTPSTEPSGNPMNRPPKAPMKPSRKSNGTKSKDNMVKPSESNLTKTIKPTKQKPVKPKSKHVTPAKPFVTADKDDKHYVKDRLNKLKQEYIENVDDVEDLIEERLDSFRGAINQIRSESKEPSIIWSFDASDVQEAMKDTILQADTKVIMMYPWIRNIDVGILKKFMDTKSRMIIQEAGLDDDASVELIKVLLDNNVQIRTMPHIHTVAVVSDDKHGLIISTDPIYDSFEVGVIYKDEKSILEIEKLFEEAWSLSKDIVLGN